MSTLLFLSRLGFWSGNLFLIAPFPDRCLLVPFCVCFHIFGWVWVTEWPPIGKIAAHSAYDMFSWYKCLVAESRFLEWESLSDCAFS